MTCEPTGPTEWAAHMPAWHDDREADLERARDDERIYDHLGIDVVLPPHQRVGDSASDLLGRVVLDEAGPGQRVLDMGTGSGINAILAANRGAEVVAVDEDPHAVEAAAANARRNGVADRITIARSTLFEAVEGRFDLIVFGPPVRWMEPLDRDAVPMTDEDYRSLTAFFAGVRDHLLDHGRVLVLLGTTADVGYLERLVGDSGMRSEVVARHPVEKGGRRVEYRTYLVEAA